MVSSMPRPHFTPGKEPVPILQEAGWAPGPVWTGGKSRPHLDSIPDRPVRSQSLYRLSYPDRIYIYIYIHTFSKVKSTGLNNHLQNTCKTVYTTCSCSLYSCFTTVIFHNIGSLVCSKIWNKSDHLFQTVFLRNEHKFCMNGRRSVQYKRKLCLNLNKSLKSLVHTFTSNL